MQCNPCSPKTSGGGGFCCLLLPTDSMDIQKFLLIPVGFARTEMKKQWLVSHVAAKEGKNRAITPKGDLWGWVFLTLSAVCSVGGGVGGAALLPGGGGSLRAASRRERNETPHHLPLVHRAAA